MYTSAFILFCSVNITEKSSIFVQLWAVLFNPNTIDTYRVGVMNASLIITELEEVIIKTQLTESPPYLTNVIFVVGEAARILKGGFICQKR
jgi:hypothetical protein